MIKLGEDKIVPPANVSKHNNSLIIAISNEGRLLAIEKSELPNLGKGKGNRLINMRSLLATGEELKFVAVIANGETLTIYSGKRHMCLNLSDLKKYQGKPASHGKILPRGFQNIDSVA